MATRIGTVKALSGEVTATATDGSIRTLQVGDVVYANELITTADGSAVEIEFADGSVMDLGRSSQAFLDSEVFDPSSTAVADFTSDSVPDDVAAIQQALLEGEDPTEVGEATAAGAGVEGTGNEGHEPVFVDYLNPEVTPDAGFDTIGVSNSYDLPEEDIIILEEEEEPSGPVVSVSVDVEIEIDDQEPPQTDPPTDGIPTPDYPVLVEGNAASVLEGTSEGTKQVVFIINLSEAFDQDVQVTYELRPVSNNGAADNPDDWFDGVSPQTVTIPAGDTSFPVYVEIVEDRLDEANGTFEIVLIDAVNATINPDASAATVTIYDDDTTPVAQDDTNTVMEDGYPELQGEALILEEYFAYPTTSGNVISGVHDDSPFTPAAQEDTDDDGDTLEIVSFSDADENALPGDTITGDYGTLTLNADGSYVYVLTSNSDPAIQGLSEGETLTDVFNYVVAEDHGSNADQTATLTIIIQGKDDGASVVTAVAQGPDATVYEAGLNPDGSDAASDSETTTGSFTVSATDGILNVVIGGTTFTLAEVQAFDGTQTVSTGEGTLTLTGYTGDAMSGTINYSYTLDATIDNDSVVATGDDAVTLAHFDDSTEITVNGVGGTTASDDLVIRAIDDTPTANDDGPVDAAEDTAVDITVDVNDVAGADGVDFTDGTKVFVSTAASNGTVIYNDDGTFTYTPDAGFEGVDTFVYTITDNDGDTDTATVTINVAPDSEPEVSVSNTAVDETGGLDSVDGTLSVDFGNDTGAIALSATGATWSAGTNTLTANDGSWKVVNNQNGTYTFTQLAAMSHLGGEDASIVLNIGVTATDSDGDIDNASSFTVTVYDDGPVVTDYDGVINTDAASGLEVLDYDLGLDGLGSVSFSLAGSSVPLTSGGQAVLTESVDLGDGREQLVGYLESGDNAGYQEGEDGVVFSIAPQSPDADPTDGTYELTLSSDNVLDLPQDTVELSFSGISAGGPQPFINVGTELTISAVDAGTTVNASSGFIGIDNNVMNDNNGGETVLYTFNNTLVNDLQFDIKDVGNGTDSISFTVFNSVDNTSEVGTLDINGDGLTGAISTSIDFDSIEFTVTNGDFKVGGISYTDTGDPQDVLVQFDYQGQDSDGDSVNGSVDVTVTAIDATTQTGSDILNHPDSQVDAS